MLAWFGQEDSALAAPLAISDQVIGRYPSSARTCDSLACEYLPIVKCSVTDSVSSAPLVDVTPTGPPITCSVTRLDVANAVAGVKTMAVPCMVQLTGILGYMRGSGESAPS